MAMHPKDEIMQLASENQKNKMRKLGIQFTDDITIEEAREALADELLDGVEVEKKNNINNNKSIGENTLVENSDWND